MADLLNELVRALTAREEEKLALNPWFQIAQSAPSMSGYHPNANLGTNIGAGFAKGFLGGFAGKRALGDYRRGLSDNLKVANEYLSASPDERDAILAANPDLGEEAFYLRAYNEQEKRKEREKEQAFKNDLNKTFLKSKLKSIVESPATAEQMSRIKFGKNPDGTFDIQLERSEPIGEELNGSVAARKKRRQIAGVDLPTSPLDEVKDIGNELAGSNIPRASAGAIARTKFESRGKADDRFSKALEENYNRATALSTYLDETGRLLQSAGETGGPEWVQSLRDNYDYVMNSEQYDARGKLATFDADTLRFMRVPGAGTTSDKDLAAYIRGGISNKNRPDVNTDIHGRLSRLRDKILEEHEFMSVWNNANQTYQGATQVLSKFNKQFPIFVDDFAKDAQGKLLLDEKGNRIPIKALNPDRPNPAEWLAQQLEGPLEASDAEGIGVGDAGQQIGDREARIKAREEELYQQMLSGNMQ